MCSQITVINHNYNCFNFSHLFLRKVSDSFVCLYCDPYCGSLKLEQELAPIFSRQCTRVCWDYTIADSFSYSWIHVANIFFYFVLVIILLLITSYSVIIGLYSLVVGYLKLTTARGISFDPLENGNHNFRNNTVSSSRTKIQDNTIISSLNYKIYRTINNFILMFMTGCCNL